MLWLPHMTLIELAWYGFWTGAGASVAWALAAHSLSGHTSAARFIGAVAGFAAAHILPRVLVHYLIELPRARRATQETLVSQLPLTVPLLPPMAKQ